MTNTERARFTSKHTSDDPNACWVWTGPLDSDGYGTFWLRRMNRRAHRVAYWASVGDIPIGTVIDHTCSTRACVNPKHLRCLSARENSARNPVAIANAHKTHCPRGHLLDRKYGKQRYCSTCDREKQRRLRIKWRREDTLNC